MSNTEFFLILSAIYLAPALPKCLGVLACWIFIGLAIFFGGKA